ncbi:glycerol-3-phosphate 1-O-acyltransferase PlsY [Paracoccus beibuensis]|uniref:glycerol-3-phosphate 1-O-acyltransferase PlsY n=1 Tax=Paracoccus beibuensis TaxID=547602 RepID=UPI0022409BFD|nr:glycerol-3-phosphate 1-O-acyltransferase PlsY [Paracoccus beibuensis]
MSLILWAVFGYLLGAVPFGIVITRALGLGDLRRIGSGNIGATNVLRTGNKPAALATLLLDSGKGAIAVLLARHFGGETAAILAGGAAFLGHCFPVWLGFKGGKGVATFLGTLIALHWPLGLIACATWALTAAVSRISSLSALLAAALAPVFAWGLGRMDIAWVAAFMAVLIFIRHHGNISRLLNGTEPRIGRK